MAKEGRFWFDHDYGARNDDKILELRAEFKAEGYGIFWMLIETMAEGETASIDISRIGGLSHGYGVAKAKLLKIIQFCVKIELLTQEGNLISSQRIKNHKVARKIFSEKGKLGADKRWGRNSPPIAPPMPKNSRGQDITGHNNTEVGSNLLSVSNAEDEILKNQIAFERICMNAHKDAETGKLALRKFHLFLEEKRAYPQTKKQVFAGFERWLMDERNVVKNSGNGEKRMVI